MQNNPYVKILKYLLSIGIVIVIFFFMGRQLYFQWDELSRHETRFNYKMLLLSFIPLIFNFLINTIYFQHLLKNLGESIDSLNTFKVLYISQLGKYIPGGIWPILGQFYLFEKQKISKLTVFIANVTLILLDTISVLLVFIPFYLIFFSNQFRYLNILLLIIIAFCVFLLNPKMLNKVVRLVNVKLKSKDIALEYKFHDLVYLVMLGVLDWLILGTGLFFLISSFHSIPVIYIAYLSGTFALSWIIGTLSFIVPNGLGIREGTLSYFLTFLLPPPISIIVALLARIWITIGDVISSMIAFLVVAWQDKGCSYRFVNFVRRVI